MAVNTEGKYLGDALLWEVDAAFRYCRDDVTILAGSGAERALTRCMVVGKVTKGDVTTQAWTGNAGGGDFAATPTAGAAAMAGKHTVEITGAGATAPFIVRNPLGEVLGNGKVGTAFDAGGIAFTLSDGTPDFAAGDGFDIIVAAGSDKVVQIDFSGTDGREDAVGILVDDVTAPDGSDAKGVIVARGPAILKASGLVWPAGATTNQKNAALAQLRTLGFVIRTDI